MGGNVRRHVKVLNDSTLLPTLKRGLDHSRDIVGPLGSTLRDTIMGDVKALNEYIQLMLVRVELRRRHAPQPPSNQERTTQDQPAS